MFEAEKLMRHIRERIAVLEHERAKPLVRDGFHAVIHREHSADIRMHDKTSEGAQDFLRVIPFGCAAPFGMGNRNDAIERWMDASKRLQA